jgi:effector-binding domain-containing protein
VAAEVNEGTQIRAKLGEPTSKSWPGASGVHFEFNITYIIRLKGIAMVGRDLDPNWHQTLIDRSPRFGRQLDWLSITRSGIGGRQALRCPQQPSSQAMLKSILSLSFFVLIAGLAAQIAGCQNTPSDADQVWPAGVSMPDVSISVAPFDVVHTQWKQRRATPYIYLEHVGDNRQAGAKISQLLQAAKEQSAPLDGAPFILFYDDPGVTPMNQLRSRVAIAINGDFSASLPLYVDQLPSENVVYAAVGGPFPDVRMAYPKMLEYLASRNWQARPPIREIYLTDPVNTPLEDLITEVQIPWVPGG